MPFIRSISGLRATLGNYLNPETVAKYSAALNKILPEGYIVIGRDGRPSGEWIEQIIAGTLAASGREVRLLGVVPTPTVQLYVEHGKAVGGISITASHNTKEWNGMKFINKDGVFFGMRENSELWDAAEFADFKYSSSPDRIAQNFDDSAIFKHVAKILELPIFDEDVVDKIKSRRFKVVVDAANASGSKAMPELLESFGCEVVELHCKGDGIFPRKPEPIPRHLKLLSDEVKEQKADLGLALDPDGDRLVIICENGSPIGEERTIVLAIEAVLSAKERFLEENEKPIVVVNQSTTSAVEIVAEKYDAKVIRSAVGEINVVKEMKKHRALIGGEGSGGVILPACHYGRDALVGAALVLYLAAVREKSFCELTGELPDYKIAKIKKRFRGNLEDLYKAIINLFPNGEPVRGDGVKIIFPESWIHIRASNTEPIVRIIAEDKDLKETKNLIRKVSELCDKL